MEECSVLDARTLPFIFRVLVPLSSARQCAAFRVLGSVSIKCLSNQIVLNNKYLNTSQIYDNIIYRSTSHNQDCTRASVPRTNAEATAAARITQRSRHPQARHIHPQADHPSQHPTHNHTPTDHSTPHSTMRASHATPRPQVHTQTTGQTHTVDMLL